MMRRLLITALLLLGLAAPWPDAAEAARTTPGQAAASSLTGRLLVATPDLQDPNFRHTVVYMVEHDAGGAVGLIINRTLGHGPLGKLLASVGVERGTDDDTVIPIYEGGPVERYRGFVLHSADYRHDHTVLLDELLAFRAQAEQLPDIVLEHGTQQGLVAFGYAGWGAQQLENEIAQGSWFTIAPDEALLFDDAIATKWQRALARRGVDL